MLWLRKESRDKLLKLSSSTEHSNPNVLSHRSVPSRYQMSFLDSAGDRRQRRFIWELGTDFGQLRIVPPKKQKSNAPLKQCEMSLFNLFGGYYTFQWKDLLQVVDVQLLWAKMLNQSHLPCDDGKDWRDMGLKSLGRDLLTTLWAEPKHDIWERAGLDMDCNPIFSTNHPIKCGYPSLTRTHITIRLVVRKSSMYLVTSLFYPFLFSYDWDLDKFQPEPLRSAGLIEKWRKCDNSWLQPRAGLNRLRCVDPVSLHKDVTGNDDKRRGSILASSYFILFHVLAFGWFGNHYSYIENTVR